MIFSTAIHPYNQTDTKSGQKPLGGELLTKIISIIIPRIQNIKSNKPLFKKLKKIRIIPRKAIKLKIKIKELLEEKKIEFIREIKAIIDATACCNF